MKNFVRIPLADGALISRLVIPLYLAAVTPPEPALLAPEGWAAKFGAEAVVATSPSMESLVVITLRSDRTFHDTAELRLVATVPESRGKQAAPRLLRDVIGECRKAQWLVAEVDPGRDREAIRMLAREFPDIGIDVGPHLLTPREGVEFLRARLADFLRARG